MAARFAWGGSCVTGRGRVLALAVVLLLSACTAADGAKALSGFWIWDMSGSQRVTDGLPEHGESFERRQFLAGGKVVGFSFLALVFEHGGEALESGYGHYRVAPHTMTIWSPPKDSIDGWPNRDGIYRGQIRCGYEMSQSGTTFALSHCPFAGNWRRATETGIPAAFKTD